MRRFVITGAVLLAGELCATPSVCAQQPFAFNEFGFGPNGLGYSGFGYTTPGPRGNGYYTGLYLPPYDGGPSPDYSPIWSSIAAAPGPDPTARPVFAGDPPLARLRDRVLGRFRR